MYTFCADYLEHKLEEREGKIPKKRPTFKDKNSFLRREPTFNLYATDSDSGVESSPAILDRRCFRHLEQDEDEPPSLDTAIQRLAETIKEFDHHSAPEETSEQEISIDSMKKGMVGTK